MKRHYGHDISGPSPHEAAEHPVAPPDKETQLDRVEAKLDEILGYVKPVEVQVPDIKFSVAPYRRRWWQRNPKPEFSLHDMEAIIQNLDSRGSI